MLYILISPPQVSTEESKRSKSKTGTAAKLASKKEAFEARQARRRGERAAAEAAKEKEKLDR